MQTDVDHLNIQIERTERLLAYQQVVVARMMPHMSPRYVATLKDLTEMMEDRLAALYRQQRQHYQPSDLNA